tara:strand:+ start:5960 stop:6328 length:369 start_codon:yes stop_codon:yes gene_type:complete
MSAGVKVISVLAYIIGGIHILAGLWFILGIGFLQDAMEGFFASYFSGFGVVLIAIGLVILYIGRSLWNRKNWARRAVLVIVTLNLLGTIAVFTSTAEDIAKVIVYLGIIVYLSKKEIKKEFS